MLHRGRLTLIFLLLLASACRTAVPPRYRIVAYVFRGRAEIDRISAQKLTHINYAFALVSESGEVILRNPDAPAHLAQIQALKARNPKLKVILSVGGWGADNFSDAAFSGTTRKKFAESAIALMRRYALDGIDLDWEYPGQPGPGIAYREEDRENFTLLLKTMREHLDALSDERKRVGYDRYTLSIASAGGPYFKHTEMDRLHPYVDWINIMTYDFTVGASTTGHHAGLYALPGNPHASSAGFVKQHLDAGIPSRKLVMGVPLYGRVWCGVNLNNRGLFQSYENATPSYPYSTLLHQYVDQQGFTRYWDAASHAPFLWNPQSATLISYEDMRSLREKARFIRKHRLGGVMYWEHSHDPDENLLNVLYSNLR